MQKPAFIILQSTSRQAPTTQHQSNCGQHRYCGRRSSWRWPDLPQAKTSKMFWYFHTALCIQSKFGIFNEQGRVRD
jgi:hypothetical protein